MSFGREEMILVYKASSCHAHSALLFLLDELPLIQRFKMIIVSILVFQKKQKQNGVNYSDAFRMLNELLEVLLGQMG